jgi:predicted MFS family arabinose efflux permease
VGDYFPEPAERTRAMSIYWMGSPLAVILSLILGGRLNDLVGWRMTFFLMGIPGLILALVVKATLKEPRLLASSNSARPSAPSIRGVLRLMWTRRAVRHLSIALVLVYALSYGLSPWEAAFLSRNHGMGTAELGFWLGLILSVGGIAGLVVGGYVATRWFAGNERGQANASAAAIAAVVPCFVAFLTVPGKYQALAAFVPIAVTFICFLGPIFALMQRLVPAQMRATMLAVIMLVANLIGMGLGPQIVGILSDWLQPVFGNDSLRYAMLMLSFLGLWAAYHFRAAGTTVARDLEAAAAEDNTGHSPVAELHDRRPQSGLSR